MTCGKVITNDWGNRPVVIQNVASSPSIIFDAGWFSSLQVAIETNAPEFDVAKSICLLFVCLIQIAFSFLF
jgi:hypothetical protein